ncbi:hypothetical protein M8C21_004205 [Ambrosia artemisiifolia]|uniref:Bifunctional inhibitor/plant lipid transfer protein/seed storage helical domain-containing protein n=1 Tax=Ambrosia artemisiifolia TaxID=4212 RepID=A0AAD5GPX5_AMBAR|nr:hypothetical protein M8C21_004205 [Ambrosia artemisiifolia]
MMVACIGGGWAEEEGGLAEQCSQKLPAVMTCVAFASGKESRPQEKCCESVKEMRERNPACLCFLIQQIHNGTNPALQKMNIQEARLLQLPSACNILNASITDCPKLLKLPPNSPDAAIFNNVTSSTITPTTTGVGVGGASTTPSHAYKHEATTLLSSINILISVFFFLVFFVSGFGV